MRYITGSTRGLGLYLKHEFNCFGFDRPEYNIEQDINNICSSIEQDSLVILNAYANGTQLDYLERLNKKCSIVVCGSIASTFHNPDTPKYSKTKESLENEFVKLSRHSTHPMLYLKLTSTSYKNYKLIGNTIRFWIDNPNFTFAGFNIK